MRKGIIIGIIGAIIIVFVLLMVMGIIDLSQVQLSIFPGADEVGGIGGTI